MTEQAMQNPVVWCVGGVDSSGGAGITRDITTLTSLNIHACAITTLLSAQSHTSTLCSDEVTANVFRAQWQVLEKDLPPNAIKIGALANNTQAHTICSNIQRLSSPRPFIAWDPVFTTSSGGHLCHLGSLTHTAITQLLRTVDVVTPNIDELAALSRLPITDKSSLVAAAQQLILLGAKAVLVKGGHAQWQDDMVDVLLTNDQIVYFTQSTHSTVLLRGTGCMLASACCGFVVKGYSLIDALTLAIAYVRETRSSALRSIGESAKASCSAAFWQTCVRGACEVLASAERRSTIEGSPAARTVEKRVRKRMITRMPRTLARSRPCCQASCCPCRPDPLSLRA